eukprot:283487_1
MMHGKIRLNVVKYLIEDMGCSVMPTENDNLIFEYFTWLSRREKINWHILDYMYKLRDSNGKQRIDFKFKRREYVSILHKYCHQLDCEDTSQVRSPHVTHIQARVKKGKNIVFNCDDFKKLINKYDLKSILDEWINTNDANKSTNPSPAALFYEHRAHEIRPDIIKLFHKELGFDIKEPINNLMPLQHYCSGGEPKRYIVQSIVKSFIDDGGADVSDKLPGQSGASMCQVMANTVDEQALVMMVNNFNVKLINAKKRTQDVWYTFMNSYKGEFNEFVTLMTLYIDYIKKNSNFKPSHLFHDNKKDKDKRIQSKLYKVFRYGPNGNKQNDEIKYTEKEKEGLQLKKNKKKLKLAKKLNERIVIVTDSRDVLFRACKVIDSRSSEDRQTTEIPQKWLYPITYKYIAENINNMQKIYKLYRKSTIGQKLASNIIIMDFNTISKINNDMQSALKNDKIIIKKQTINDIKLRNNNNLLMKYIRSNHRNDINADHINEMFEMGINFKTKNQKGYHALDIYCKKSKGEINKQVIKSLIKGCSINWPYEETKKDDDDSDTENESDNEDEDGDTKQDIIKGDYTPLHHYCMLKESNLKGFQILVECGADVTIESKDNVSAIYYLLKFSENLNENFIKYLANVCKINFYRLLPSGWNLLNHYLNTNKNINRDTIIALCDIAGCDPHSRDDENDQSSIKAYIKSDIATFKFDIISCLVELGANINEPDSEGVFPIQHVLQLEYTPIKKLINYLCNMIEAGAKLSHILPDDPLSIEDNKLFILQNMKDGYESYDNYVCRIESWRYGSKKKGQQVQTAIALHTFGTTKLYIRLRRQNLIDVTQEMLFKEYPQFKKAYESQQSDDHDETNNDNIDSPRLKSIEHDNDNNNNNGNDIEEEEEKQENNDKNNDNIEKEIHTLMSGQT